MTNLDVHSHPGLKIDRRFQMNIPASPTMAQQVVSMNLPPMHYYLRIVPTISDATLARPHKLLVSANDSLLKSLPSSQAEADSRRPAYETRVLPGLNRIEVEVVAGYQRGAPKPAGSGQELEMEKITVFANLMTS